MNLNRIKQHPLRSLLILMAAALVFSSFTRVSTYAASGRVPDTIRVGLFLNLPAKNFTSLTPVATLQSPSGLQVSWRDPQLSVPVSVAAPGETVRFAMDGYKAIVLETADLNAALTVLKKLQASTKAAFITKLTKSGKAVYQVSEGVYATSSSASSALAKWTSARVAEGVPSLASAKVAGPWAAEAGPYAGAAEAAAAAAQIGAAGLDTFAAVKVQNGVLSYVVRIGQGADASAAASMQRAAVAAGASNVRVPAPEEPYAVIRQDMTLTGTVGRAVTLYGIPASAGVVLRAEPAGGGTTQLTERSKRLYRGAIEMSVLANSLAVVNELKFEQYLYSVVGAEIGSSWPLEAQKAQAVAARSYALAASGGFQVANVVDTTLSQAYNGTASENPNAIAGVDATAGELLVQNNKVVSAVFSSNAGGMTADNRTEVWGSDTPYLNGAVTSPDDSPQQGKLDWYDVATESGKRGFVRSDLLADGGKNAAGLMIMRVTTDSTALRSRPMVETSMEPIARLAEGTDVIVLGKVPEYTAYSWVERPAAPEQLLASLNKYVKVPGPLQTLEVAAKGPSGRATQLKANGDLLSLKYPDSWRSALGGVRSTLISIEETARMSMIGAGGGTRELPQTAGPVQILGADGATASAAGGNLFVMNGGGKARLVTSDPSFIISGKGYGHGLGMSQYGAQKLAEQGNDYISILKYYYKNVTIEKDAAQ